METSYRDFDVLGRHHIPRHGFLEVMENNGNSFIYMKKRETLVSVAGSFMDRVIGRSEIWGSLSKV